MGEIAARLADRAYLTTDNPRSEDPGRDRRRRPRRRAGRSRRRRSVELDRRRRDPRARSPTARRRRRRGGRGQGSRDRPDRRRRDDAVRRPRRRARRAGGVLVTRLTAARDRAPRRRRRRRRRRPTPSSTSWAFDSRALEPGACFVALRGHRDGHDFVGAAFGAGARVALVDRSEPFSGRPGHAGARSCGSTTCSRGLQDVARSVRARRAPSCASSASPARPARRRRRTSSPPCSRRSGCYASPESYNNEFGLPITLLQRAGARARRRHRDGRAVPRRPRGAVRDRPARRSVSSPTSGSRTPSTSAAARASAAVLGELLEALPARRRRGAERRRRVDAAAARTAARRRS